MAARIPLYESDSPPQGEMVSRFTGWIGDFRFARSDAYWRVTGPVQMAIADKLYANPIGRDAIRANGDAGRRPPSLFCRTRRSKDGNLVRVVDLYHVDTTEGLELFVEMLLRHGQDTWEPEFPAWTLEGTEEIARDFGPDGKYPVDGLVAQVIADLARDPETCLFDVNDPRIVEILRRIRDAR